MVRRVFCLFSALLFVTAAFAQDLSGTWTASLPRQGRDRVNFQFRFDQSRHSQIGDAEPLQDLVGLTLEQINSPSADAKFQLKREAGVINFDGHFHSGTGVGDFIFTLDAQYVSDIAAMGYSNPGDKKLFELAVINVTRGRIKELKALGFTPSLDELIEAAIFNVNRDQVEGLKAVGYDNLPFKKLVELRVHGVTPEYIKQVRGEGFNVPLDTLIEMKIFGVTPEFRQQITAAGLANIDAKKLVEFRIHGVTPEFIKEMSALGLGNLSANELVEMKIFHVNAAQVEELKSLGYSGLTEKQLVELRVHNIGREFIEKVKKAGYQHPSINEIVEMKILGIRRNSAQL